MSSTQEDLNIALETHEHWEKLFEQLAYRGENASVALSEFSEEFIEAEDQDPRPLAFLTLWEKASRSKENAIAIQKEIECQQQAEKEFEAIQALNEIIENRISYNTELIHFLENGSKSDIENYLRQVLNHPPLNALDFSLPDVFQTCVKELQKGAQHDINQYQYFKEYVKENCLEPLFFEIFHDLVWLDLEIEGNEISEAVKTDPLHEHMYWKNILAILKSFLTPEYANYKAHMLQSVETSHFNMKLDSLLKKTKEKLDDLKKINNKILNKHFCMDADELFSLENDLNNLSKKISDNQILSDEKKTCLQEKKPKSLSNTRLADIKPGGALRLHAEPDKRKINEFFLFIKKSFYELKNISDLLNEHTRILSKGAQLEEKIEKAKKRKANSKLHKSAPATAILRGNNLDPLEEAQHLPNIVEQPTEENRVQQLTSAKDPSQLIEDFKREKNEALRRYKKEVKEKRQAKKALVIERKRLLEQNSRSPEVESKELQEHEISQLQYLAKNLKNHLNTLNSIFSDDSLNFKDLEYMVTALSPKALIDPEKLQSFKLINFSGGGSHFSVFIPNTYKIWTTVPDNQNDPYNIKRSDMSTINGWCSHGTAHDNEILRPDVVKRCADGLTRAGITPERIKEALSFSLKPKSPAL